MALIAKVQSIVCTTLAPWGYSNIGQNSTLYGSKCIFFTKVSIPSVSQSSLQWTVLKYVTKYDDFERICYCYNKNWYQNGINGQNYDAIYVCSQGYWNIDSQDTASSWQSEQHINLPSNESRGAA